MKIIGKRKRRKIEKVCSKCGAILEIESTDAEKTQDTYGTHCYIVTCPKCDHTIYLGFIFDDIFPWT